MRPSRWIPAVALGLVSATVVLAGVFGPGPNSTTVPSTGQQLSIRITAPTDNSVIPIPPGTVQVQGNCAVGTVAGQTINVLYVVDVSGSTDLDFMLQNGEPRVDANGNGVAGDAGDDFNGDGERGDVLDGEVAGVLALHASIGNPSNVNVGVVAFATDASAADVDPATPNAIPITQFFTNPPQADRNGTGGPDINEVLRSLDSDFTNPSGGQIKKFTAVSRSILGSGTRFPQALAAANAALTHFPAGSNIIFFLSDGASNDGSRCFQGACSSQLSTAVTAHTKINTIGVGADADPVDLQYIATQTGGTYTQVTNPSQLSTILPFITPAGLGHATVNGSTVALDSLGNFTASLPCVDLDPFTVTARCFASDAAATSVAADVTLRCFLLCGNGTVDAGAGEECEPPNTATCDATCQRVPHCGDGFVDGTEQCDPPNGTTCDTDCTLITCGDGDVDAGEECEPPNTATCDAGCQRVPHCGDGFLDGAEQCDPPNGSTCAPDCTPIVCGDAVVEAPEECEPPNTVVCDATCQRVPHCGDGFVDGAEQCDPPNGTTCAADCSAIVCGDGVVEGLEECDPPNGTTCDATCQKIACTDDDHDGVCDTEDNCATAPNPDQHDADGDGIGDACDPCTDTDGDGFGDPGYPANTCPVDNCAEEPNPDQSDLDHDGIGDLCDDEEAVLNLWFTSVKASSVGRANGRTIMKGDFVTVAPLDVFDARDGIEVHLHDSLFLHNAVTWQATECFTARDPQGAIKKIKCESVDHRYKAQFKFFKLNPGAVRFIIKLLKLEPDFPFLEPVTLRLKHNGFIDRVGSISDCTKTNSGLKCRER